LAARAIFACLVRKPVTAIVRVAIVAIRHRREEDYH